MKKIFALLLALCMVFALCACGGNSDANNETTGATKAPGNETTAPTVDDGKVTYTVKVVDEQGKGVVGAMVQLCLETCLPAMTNMQGVATYRVNEADYKVSFVQMPAGYTTEEAEFHFAEGSYELTITLKAEAVADTIPGETVDATVDATAGA